jgi:subtilisin-like proprotein convertase family protein
MKHNTVMTHQGWVQARKSARPWLALAGLNILAALVWSNPASMWAATSFRGTNSSPITINDATADNQGNVTFAAATPYPSTIAVSGLTGEVSHVTVTVRNLAHSSCFDISMLLVSPQGQGVVLMSQDGGINPISVSSLTFDDSATSALWHIGPFWQITNGVYRPTDAASSNFFVLPAPPGPYPTNFQNNYDITLGALNGSNPNGTWSLYVQDESPIDTGGITNGWSLTIATAPAISGSIAAYGSGKGVPSAKLTLTGDTNTAGFSTATGTYQLLINPGGSYSVTPSKADDLPPNNGVTTFDILLIRQHILNSSLLNSPYKILAADANGSKSVTTADILPIRQLVLGNTTNLPGGLWKFVPASYVFPDPMSPWGAPTNLSYTNLVGNLDNQNFIAIKVGDVNSSWGPPMLAHIFGSTVGFNLPSLTAQPGDTVNVALGVSAFQAVTSVQFTLQWDPTVLEFLGVGDFGLPSLAADNFGTNHVDNGDLTFSWDDPQLTGVALTDGTTIFTTSFRVLGNNGSSSTLSFVDSPTSREVTVSAALGTFNGQNGAINVGGVTNVPPPVITAGLDAGKTAFQLSISTVPGATYIIEYTDALPPAGWTTLTNFVGDGSIKLATDQGFTNQQRFYRVRAQ